MADVIRWQNDDFGTSGDIRDEVVRLVAEGHSAVWIANAMGLSEKRTYTIIHEEFAKRNGSREDMKMRMAAQIDMVTRDSLEIWKRSKGGDKKAAELIVKCWERKARLFGLDEATKVDVKHSIEEMTTDEINAELRILGVLESEVKTVPQLPPATALTEPIPEAEYQKVSK